MNDLDAGNDAVAKLAYEYWEAEGRPNGRDVEHWLRAEQAVDATVRKYPRTPKNLKRAQARKTVFQTKHAS